MARITPSSGGTPLENPVDVNLVRPLAPYQAILERTDWITGSAQYGSQQRLVLDWVLPEVGGGQRVRDYAGLALGQSADGVAVLRRILNAIAGAPEQTEVSFFDDESLEWGYQGADGPAFARLQPGVRVTLHGEIKARRDNTGYFFNPTHYYPPQQQSAPRPAPQPAPQPAPVASSPQPNGQPAPAWSPGSVQPSYPQPGSAAPQPQPVGSFSGVPPGTAPSSDAEVPF